MRLQGFEFVLYVFNSLQTHVLLNFSGGLGKAECIFEEYGPRFEKGSGY